MLELKETLETLHKTGMEINQGSQTQSMKVLMSRYNGKLAKRVTRVDPNRNLKI